LESDTILTIAQAKGIDIHEITGDWGVLLSDALQQIQEKQALSTLRDNVLLVELPGKTAVAYLESLGKRVWVIDHHQYGAETTLVNRASSLEQFAALIGHKLTTPEWEIAINDRDFLPGLAQAGVSWMRACEIRHAEHQVRGTVEKREQARREMHRYCRDFEDVRLVLAPEAYRGIMLELAQYPSEEIYITAAQAHQAIKLKPVLVLYHTAGNPQDIVQIEYAGAAKELTWIRDIGCDPRWALNFTLWSGGGTLGCFFGAKQKVPGLSFDALVSLILSHTLFTGRPLRHYSCTYYVPLDLFSEEDLEKQLNQTCFAIKSGLETHQLDADQSVLPNDIDTPPAYEQQAFLYFEPHLREALIDIKKPTLHKLVKSIQHWRLPAEQTAAMQLTLGDVGENALSAQLTDVSLYRYFNGLFIIAFRLVPVVQLGDTSNLTHDDARWWHDLVFAEDKKTRENLQTLKMQNWLKFTKLARIIYPSFREQVKEAKITTVTLTTAKTPVVFKKEEKLSPVLMYLIEQFLTIDNNLPATREKLSHCLKYLPDDRMFVVPAYGLAGEVINTPHIQERMNYLLSLALYVDHLGDTYSSCQDYAYDPEFTRNLLKEHSLTRWQATGSYSGYCIYAHAYLGMSGFFNKVIAPSHVPYIYGRMTLLGLFYQATLRHYNRRISYATKALTEQKSTDSFRKLRKHFIEFTNNYWFREISPQIQAIEIFNLQTKALNLEAEYHLIKDEMERADEYTTALREQEFNHASKNFNHIAAVFATLALFIGVFGVSTKLPELVENYGFATASIASTLAVLYALWRIFGKKN